MGGTQNILLILLKTYFFRVSQVLVAMPYASRNFYVITFHGGDNLEFSVNHFPASVSDHVEGLTNFAVCRVAQTSLMYLAGGQHIHDQNMLTVGQGLVYDVIKDYWCPAPSLPPHPLDFSNVAMAAAGGKVYLVCPNGTVYESALNIECIDPVCDNHPPVEAPPLPPPPMPPHFVIGHHSESTWRSVARMNFPRSSVSLVGIGKRLYAIGGMQAGGFTSIVEMYDADANVWVDVDSMGESRCNPGVAVAGGKIYVVGGVGDRDVQLPSPPRALRTVEYYDVSSICCHFPLKKLGFKIFIRRKAAFTFFLTVQPV